MSFYVPVEVDNAAVFIPNSCGCVVPPEEFIVITETGNSEL